MKVFNKRHTILYIYLVLALAFFLTACSSGRPTRQVDPELYRNAKSARTAFAQGEYKLAVRLYRRALNRARAMDNAIEIGNNAYNLAASLMELGDYDQSRKLLEESRSSFKRAGKVPEGVFILEIKNALGRESLEEAQELLEAAVSRNSVVLVPEMLIQYKLLAAEIALKLGDLTLVQRELESTRDDLGQVKDSVLEGDFKRVEGELLFLQDKFADAGIAFDRWADFMRKGEQYNTMSVALGKAGAAYQKAENYCASLDRYFRSARSLYAQEDQVAALKMIEAALEVAPECEDESSREQIRNLFLEIKGEAGLVPVD